jgi:hypothetical protein
MRLSRHAYSGTMFYFSIFLSSIKGDYHEYSFESAYMDNDSNMEILVLFTGDRVRFLQV